MNMELTKDDLIKVKNMVENKIVSLRERESNFRPDFSKGSLSLSEIKKQRQEEIEYYELLKVKINLKLNS